MKKVKPDIASGRAALSNPKNRFEALEWIADEAGAPQGQPRTQLFRDRSQSILSRNDSPDLGFNVSVNPYRGCEHGCIYCYARPTHEYLGFSAGLDFESRILVKDQAPRLLHEALSAPAWTPQVIAISGVTDAYQPVERRLGLTRRCIEVLAAFRNPVAIVTKNFLVTRDIDVLSELARHHAVSVTISITTLRPELARAMEPRASAPKKRLEAIRLLHDAGIPVGVNVAPIIPGLTDEEIPAIIQAAAEVGAQFAGSQILRLPHGVKDLFSDWLRLHFPQTESKVLNRIRAVRGNELNDARFGVRFRGEGVFAEQMAALFNAACRKTHIGQSFPALSVGAFRRSNDQLALFS